ncbi:hypothetical protein DTL76_26685, partial [Escherichia coli]
MPALTCRGSPYSTIIFDIQTDPFYTHISDQYAPFSTRVVNVGVRDSTYVLDGLLYHESDLRIE